MNPSVVWIESTTDGHSVLAWAEQYRKGLPEYDIRISNFAMVAKYPNQRKVFSPIRSFFPNYYYFFFFPKTVFFRMLSKNFTQIVFLNVIFSFFLFFFNFDGTGGGEVRRLMQYVGQKNNVHFPLNSGKRILLELITFFLKVFW